MTSVTEGGNCTMKTFYRNLSCKQRKTRTENLKFCFHWLKEQDNQNTGGAIVPSLDVSLGYAACQKAQSSKKVKYRERETFPYNHRPEIKATQVERRWMTGDYPILWLRKYGLFPERRRHGFQTKTDEEVFRRPYHLFRCPSLKEQETI